MPIHLTIENGLAEIVLDQPAILNALDAAGLDQLSRRLEDAAAAGVRALLLRGEGRAFSAGRDISGVDPDTDDAAGYLARVTRVMRALSEFPAPTFAVAHGACLGVGLGLLIATDVVYVAASATIGSPFVNLGATLDSGGHALFVARLGTHRALDLIYTGELMSGADAVTAGLFSRVVPDAEVLDFARERAAAVAAGPTGALLASKVLVRRIRDEQLGFWQSIDAETAEQLRLMVSADYHEGFAAFQQKRRPSFTGR